MVTMMECSPWEGEFLSGFKISTQNHTKKPWLFLLKISLLGGRSKISGMSVRFALILWISQVKVKVKVTLRPTVSRPVRLGVRRPSGTRDQFCYLLEIFFETVAVCYVVASSLTRGRAPETDSPIVCYSKCM
jgi:hypothetical protein